MTNVKYLFRTKRLFHKYVLSGHRNASYSTLTADQAEEVKIPVPWGHVSGKWWGCRNQVPVIAIHGWLDNANSFDRIIPLLNLPSVLAIDLPGHGHSSHLPSGKTYDFQELLILLHRIIKDQNWTNVPLLTHSFGGSLGFTYAAMFSSNIKWLINIDCARTLLALYRYDTANNFSKGIKTLFNIEKQKQKGIIPAYKLSDMIKMTVMGSLGSLTTPESAMIILKRGIKLSDATAHRVTSENTGFQSNLQDLVDHEMKAGELLPEEERKSLNTYCTNLKELAEEAGSNLENFSLPEEEDRYYVFNRDPATRIKAFLSTTEEFILETSKNMKCPMLSLRTSKGFLFGSSRKMYEQSLDNVKKVSPHFEHHEVVGTHHAHLNTPENLAPVMNKFIEKFTF